MLEYTFWDNRNSIYTKETIADFIKVCSSNMKDLDETLVTFDIALLQFFIFNRHEELESLTVLFQNGLTGLRKGSRKKLMDLSKIKSLFGRKQYE
jgi:hypothetical protein